MLPALRLIISPKPMSRDDKTFKVYIPPMSFAFHIKIDLFIPTHSSSVRAEVGFLSTWEIIVGKTNRYKRWDEVARQNHAKVARMLDAWMIVKYLLC